MSKIQMWEWIWDSLWGWNWLDSITGTGRNRDDSLFWKHLKPSFTYWYFEKAHPQVTTKNETLYFSAKLESINIDGDQPHRNKGCNCVCVFNDQDSIVI